MTTAHDQIIQVFAALKRMPPDEVTTVILTLENRAAHVAPPAHMGESRQPWIDGCREEMRPVFEDLDKFAAKHRLQRLDGGSLLPFASFRAPAKDLLVLRDAPHLRGIMFDAPIRAVRKNHG